MTTGLRAGRLVPILVQRARASLYLAIDLDR
jgi:hypothetical protein